MELKRLHSDIIAKTRASYTLNTVCQIILELVLNSLDAKATAIAIRINLVTLRVQVVDNGEGITNDNIKLIGLRYFTNRCRNIDELESEDSFYGFRGEAIASLTELSKTVNITSKYVSSSKTYSITLGKVCNRLVTAVKDRPSVGTTVTVEGIFHNFPVRKKRIVKEIELDEITRNIFALIIIHPTISFSLRDDVSSELILSCRKNDDIPSAFQSLHPEIKDGTVLKISKGKISIKALLFKSYSENKKLQYIYVNRRPIFSARIQKLVNRHLNKNMKSRKHQLENKNKYPIYVLNIKCPYSDVYILHNLSKTMAEFRNWERVEECIEKLINSFFGKNSSSKQKHVEAEKSKETVKRQEKGRSECGISQIHGVVQAYGYKRKNYDLNVREKAKKSEASFPKSVLKECTSPTIKLIEEPEVCDIIEATEPPCKAEIKRFKSPLPITILPKDKVIYKNNLAKEKYGSTISEKSQLVNDTLSKFTNDENKGKNLILDMFLKSTQVYNTEENVQNQSQDSGETVFEEESNFLFENNIQTKLNGMSKTMSVSVNLKTTKKIKRHHQKTTEKGIQTTFENKMLSKALQTSLKQKSTLQDVDGTSIFPDNFTLVRSKNENFKFVFKKPKSVKDFNFAYLPNCNCNCHENIFFNFGNHNYNFCSMMNNHPRNDLFNFGSTEKEKKRKFCRGFDQNIAFIPEYHCRINRKRKTNEPIYKESPYFVPRNEFAVNSRHIQATSRMSCKNNYYQHNPQKFSNFEKVRNNFLCLDKGHNVDSNFGDFTVGTFNQFNPLYKSTQQQQNFRWRHSAETRGANPVNFTSFNSKSFKGHKEGDINRQNDVNCCSEGNKGSNYPENVKVEDRREKNCEDFNNHEETALRIDREENRNKEDLTGKCSELVITLSEQEKVNLIEKELGDEKSLLLKEFLEWDSQFSQAENERPAEHLLDWTKRNYLDRYYYVNRKTGYATYQTPKPNNIFKLDERYEFLPKGMSPILKEYPPVDRSLSQNGKNTLLEYILDTYKDDLLFIKWQTYLKHTDIKSFFKNIYKEKVKMFEHAVPKMSNFNRNRDTVNLTKQVFEKLELIGQLDKKFIVAIESNQDLLILFDQHAVHERIRLENLLNIYKNSKSVCKEKIMFFIPQNELSLLKRYESYLNYIGLSVEFFNNGIYVTDVPMCLSLKFQEQCSTNSLKEVIQILINDVTELLKSTRGVSLKILPRLIQNVINLEACRGAIKFGDVLNLSQCTELLQKLSNTDLPFQCAHGRPTVTPLLKLSSGLSKENARINFANLKKKV